MEEKTLRQKQVEEALKRMELLQIMGQVRNDFRRSQKVYYSERVTAMFPATLYWVSNKQQFVDIINEFEKEHNALVYHCQLTHLEYGDNLALFYVSENEEEWAQDKEDIANGELFSRVINLQCEYDSDFGYIGIKPAMGGVVRTW